VRCPRRPPDYMTTPPPWRRAAVETTITLTTTGGTVWGAAEAAIRFFERHWDAVVVGAEEEDAAAGAGQRPLRVLELGAGCGKLGLTVALNRQGEEGGSAAATSRRVSVLLTEQPDGLAHLERNVQLNAGEAHRDLDARAVACDWADFLVAGEEEGEEDQKEERDGADVTTDKEEAAAEESLWRSCERVAPPSSRLPKPDIIIGSDLIYLVEGARALPRTLAALLLRRRGGGGVAFYSHTRHRFDALDVELEEQCAACGLEMVELDQETGRPVGEEGEEARRRAPSSPPPFSALFPEQRVAIYRITLRRREEEERG
jgi:hypothetical protein